MPKGVYDHKPRNRITKAELKKFVLFTFREDIADRLAKERYPHQVAVKLYEQETGITISSQTAYKQKGKWEYHVYHDPVTGLKTREELLEHKPGPFVKRSTKAEVQQYVDFRNRPDIMDAVKGDPKPYLKAIELFESETGIKITPLTAKRKEPICIDVPDTDTEDDTANDDTDLTVTDTDYKNDNVDVTVPARSMVSIDSPICELNVYGDKLKVDTDDDGVNVKVDGATIRVDGGKVTRVKACNEE